MADLQKERDTLLQKCAAAEAAKAAPEVRDILEMPSCAPSPPVGTYVPVQPLGPPLAATCAEEGPGAGAGTGLPTGQEGVPLEQASVHFGANTISLSSFVIIPEDEVPGAHEAGPPLETFEVAVGVAILGDDGVLVNPQACASDSDISEADVLTGPSASGPL